MFRGFFWTWVPWIFNKTSFIFSKTHAIYRVIYNEVMVKKEWIFLKNNLIPVSSEHFGNIENNAILWRCSLHPATFIQPDFNTYENEHEHNKEKHLSYLGFTVKCKGVDIDLSDWVNEVRWHGAEQPTLKEIFFLWSCEMGESYFHCVDEIYVELVTDKGDTLRLPL